MFRIDRDENRVSELERRRFGELGLREREHLQEWIAARPDMLGEELLVVQKEFNGFDGTQERLDLLALDQSGRLVVIENKLDDSGRDVVWQALKYAAYCSTLQTAQIVDLYARHVGGCSAEEAEERIADFVGATDGETLHLNPSGTQRIMLVAARFRREVTATALWLLAKGVGIARFQVTPWQSGAELFLEVSQVIPTPEAEDFMVRLAEKTASDEQVSSAEAARHRRRRAYWTRLIDKAAERGDQGLARRTPGKDNWMSVASGIAGLAYSLVIKEGEATVQLNFESPDAALNQGLFEVVRAEAERIAEAFPDETPDWRRQPDLKSSRLVLSRAVDGLDPDAWEDIIDWQLDRLARLEGPISPLVPRLREVRAAK